MATITLFPLPEAGHGGVFSRLASLLEAEHEVRICSHTDIGPFFRSRNFEFVPLRPEVLREWTYALPQEEAAEGRSARRKAEKKHAWNAFFDSLQSESLEGILGDRPDLALVDAAWPYLSLVALRSQVPSAVVSITLPLDHDAMVPPASTSLMPGTTRWSRVVQQAAWSCVGVQQNLRHFRGRMLGSRHETEYLAGLAESAGVPPDAIERRNSDGKPWTLKRTELVMCPEELDFPRARPPWRHYVEPCIDVAQLDPGLEDGDLDTPDDRPLVYCALGTQAVSRCGASRAFLEKLVQTAADSPEWRFLIAADPSLLCLREPPENVTVVRHAPQLKVLRRAALMITHGGMASVKECIWSGVPMIVFPFAVDQPGNAARVQYHGLGLYGRPDRTTPRQIRTMIQTVLDSPTIRSRIQSMSAVFQRMESEHPALQVIESLLSHEPLQAVGS